MEGLSKIFRIYAFFKIDTQLRQDLTPFTISPRPFFSDTRCCQVQEFKKSIIGWKDCPCLGDFPELTVEILYLVGCIDHPAQLPGIFEICRDLRPVVLPARNIRRILLTPVFFQNSKPFFRLFKGRSLIGFSSGLS